MADEKDDTVGPIGMSDEGDLVLSSIDYDDEFNEPLAEPEKQPDVLDCLFRGPRIIIHRR